MKDLSRVVISSGVSGLLGAVSLFAADGLMPFTASAQGTKLSCRDTHSLFVKDGVKESRQADAKFFLQVDGDVVLEKFEGFPNIYTSKVVWRDDGYIVANQYDVIGGSGITTTSIAFEDSGSALVARMHVDPIRRTTSSFFSRCENKTL